MHEFSQHEKEVIKTLTLLGVIYPAVHDKENRSKGRVLTRQWFDVAIGLDNQRAIPVALLEAQYWQWIMKGSPRRHD